MLPTHTYPSHAQSEHHLLENERACERACKGEDDWHIPPLRSRARTDEHPYELAAQGRVCHVAHNMPGSQALAAGSDATASQCNTLQYAVMETYNSSSCVQLPAGSTFDEEESEGGARREFSGARGREIADDSGEQMLHRSIAQSHGDGRGEYIRQEVAELRDHIIQLGGEGWGEREGGRGRADGDDESDNVEARELRRQIAHLVVARSLQKHQADELREQVGEKEGEREEERERKRKKERKKESQRGERRKKRQRERKRGKNKKQKERARENSRANARAIARAIAKKESRQQLERKISLL